MNKRLNEIFAGTNHERIEDAIAADLVSAIPVIGAFTDFLRVLDSETRPQKALQMIDTLTEPVPILNIVTPTNTVLYLNEKGMLPVNLERIDSLFKKFSSKNKQFKKEKSNPGVFPFFPF